jgi:hypothetical protein
MLKVKCRIIDPLVEATAFVMKQMRNGFSGNGKIMTWVQ